MTSEEMTYKRKFKPGMVFKFYDHGLYYCLDDVSFSLFPLPTFMVLVKGLAHPNSKKDGHCVKCK